MVICARALAYESPIYRDTNEFSYKFYQRHLIYLHGFNIKKACALIMKLYGAIQREDIIDLGLKIDRDDTLVFVSYPDRQLTAKSVFEKAAVVEGLDGGVYRRLIVLAWDFQMNYDLSLYEIYNLLDYGCTSNDIINLQYGNAQWPGSNLAICTTSGSG